ncbi:MAG: cyclase family protein [Planctomycetota bacterium]|jgi:arylformamidase
MIYDITPAISDSLKVWPGDTPPSREILCDLAKGATTTLSTLHVTAHVGAHADAPSHFALNASSIDERPLDTYIGPCQLIHVDVLRAGVVEPRMLGARIQAERLLLVTETFPDPTVFNEDFAALSPALIDHLAEQGVRLVGIDTPSVDPFDSKDLPTHRTFLKHDIAILEGLVLKEVPEGVYELIALPLKLVGFDAAPVRAVLRTLT